MHGNYQWSKVPPSPHLLLPRPPCPLYGRLPGDGRLHLPPSRPLQLHARVEKIHTQLMAEVHEWRSQGAQQTALHKSRRDSAVNRWRLAPAEWAARPPPSTALA